MTDEEKMRQWADTWKRAGPLLEEIRLRELREFDYEKNYELIDSMLEWSFRNSTPTQTSGMLEMQKWFKKMRK